VPVSLILAASCLSCGGSTHTLIAPAAGPGEMSHGVTLLQESGTTYVTLGAAAYSGAAGEGDTYWYITPENDLMACRLRAGRPSCVEVDIGDHDIEVTALLPYTAVGRSLGNCDEEPMPVGNHVWFLGRRPGFIRSTYSVGLCSMTGPAEPLCRLAPMPQQGDTVEGIVAVHVLNLPVPRTSAWLAVLRGRSVGRDGHVVLVRCESVHADQPLACTTARMTTQTQQPNR